MILPAYSRELIEDLKSYPARERAGRLRTLALLGLSRGHLDTESVPGRPSISKGPPPLVSATPADSADAEVARQERRQRAKQRLLG